MQKSNNVERQLKASLDNTKTTARNIKQHATNVEQRLAAPSTVFDRAAFVKTLPDIHKQTTQSNTEVTTYLQADMSKWKTDMVAWLHNITPHLTTATTSIPQLTEESLVTHRSVV